MVMPCPPSDLPWVALGFAALILAAGWAGRRWQGQGQGQGRREGA
jgi:hypothetical protein